MLISYFVRYITRTFTCLFLSFIKKNLSQLDTSVEFPFKVLTGESLMEIWSSLPQMHALFCLDSCVVI